MKKTTTLLSSQEPSQVYAKAIELASLVSDILLEDTPLAYKKKVQNMDLSRDDLHTISSLRKKQGGFSVSKDLEENLGKRTKDQKQSLEELLGSPLSINERTKIQELSSDPEVMNIYTREYTQRKESFALLARGWKQLPNVLGQEETIQQAKQRILDLRIQAFRQHKTLTPAQIAYIHKIQEMIEQKVEEVSAMLTKRELATAYRLHQLQVYKKQLDTTGFMITPSRQENIDEIIEKILLGQNVLLTGPTGTGKTVLALQAVRTIASGKTVNISGKTLSEELENTQSSKTLDDFIYVLSGHAGITPSEFIAKIALQGDGKGGTQTYTQLGKILKAFVEGAIPIIDEIDLIPNDVLMRVKHLFTLKPGNTYAPQEDNNQRHILQTSNLIATANIKSAKHTDRQELDPAIVRLFKGVEIKYLPKEETYDLALANIMQAQGFAYGVDPESLGDKNGILYLLIEALKEIEDNYLGKNEGEKISNKVGVYLSKAVLELGNFIDLFKGFQESGKDFVGYIKQKILHFVTNGAYPKSDRLILIKIFSTKGLIVKKDISVLEQRMSDISEDELNQNIIKDDFDFTRGAVPFIDPYELANLDPDSIRNMSSLELQDKTTKIRKTLQALSADLMKTTDKEVNDLVDICDALLIGFEENKDFLPSPGVIESLLGGLYERGLLEYIVSGQGVSPDRDEIIERIKLFDSLDPQGEKALSSTEVQSSSIPQPEKKEKGKLSKEKITQELIAHILKTGQDRVAHIKAGDTLAVEGGDIKLNLTPEQRNAIPYPQERDITIQKSETRNITIEGKQETFGVIRLTIKGIEYTALQIPQGIKNKPLQDMSIGERLMVHSNNTWFPNFDFSQTISKDWIIMSTSNIKDKAGDPRTNIPTQDASESEDVVRICALQGMKPISIGETLVLGEIIKYGLGDEYIDFKGQDADNDTSGYQAIRQKIKKIEDYTGLAFNEYTKDNDGNNVDIIRDRGIYKDRDGDSQAFLRGNFFSDFGALGGVCSLDLLCRLDSTDSNCGFRALG